MNQSTTLRFAPQSTKTRRDSLALVVVPIRVAPGPLLHVQGVQPPAQSQVRAEAQPHLRPNPISGVGIGTHSKREESIIQRLRSRRCDRRFSILVPICSSPWLFVPGRGLPSPASLKYYCTSLPLGSKIASASCSHWRVDINRGVEITCI